MVRELFFRVNQITLSRSLVQLSLVIDEAISLESVVDHHLLEWLFHSEWMNEWMNRILKYWIESQWLWIEKNWALSIEHCCNPFHYRISNIVYWILNIEKGYFKPGDAFQTFNLTPLPGEKRTTMIEQALHCFDGNTCSSDMRHAFVYSYRDGHVSL